MIAIDGRQHLIFDADDTLWENNIYFEEAFDQFCEYLNHSSLTPPEIRVILDEIEIDDLDLVKNDSDFRRSQRGVVEVFAELVEGLLEIDVIFPKRVVGVEDQVLASVDGDHVLFRAFLLWEPGLE